MKKAKINHRLRIILICITIILSAVSSFLIYQEAKQPDFKEEKITLFGYEQNATVDYRVFLVPNSIFATASLDEDEQYIATLLDYIQATFNYEFTGDRPADVKGTYEIVGIVEGYVEQLSGPDGKETKNKTIWQRNFPVVPKTDFQTKEQAFSINRNITINLNQYNDFVNAVNEITKINTKSKLSVLMNVEFKGNTEKGPIEEKVSPSISIPLNTNLFGITKNEIESQKGAIEETQKVQQPVNTTMVCIYGALLGLAIIAMLYLLFFTIVTVTDPYEKLLKGIFKKHGTRFVALDREIESSYYNINQVNTIDDLVKIADEIERPIMYRYSTNLIDIKKFYVYDDSHMYVCDLKDIALKLPKEKPHKKLKKGNAVTTDTPENKEWSSAIIKNDESQPKDM